MKNQSARKQTAKKRNNRRTVEEQVEAAPRSYRITPALRAVCALRTLEMDQFKEKKTNAKGSAKRASGTRKQTGKGYIRSTVIRTLTANSFQLGVSERDVLS